MQNGLLLAIVPFEGHAGPIRCLDRALIVLVLAPVDAIANLQLSGFVSGHVFTRLFFRPVGTRAGVATVETLRHAQVVG